MMGMIVLLLVSVSFNREVRAEYPVGIALSWATQSYSFQANPGLCTIMVVMYQKCLWSPESNCSAGNTERIVSDYCVPMPNCNTGCITPNGYVEVCEGSSGARFWDL